MSKLYLTTNFNSNEIKCRCCNSYVFTPEGIDSLNKLQIARDYFGKPVMVNSSYRCPAHNAAVGGAKASYHMKAMAHDTRPKNGNEMEEWIAALRASGFSYIRIYRKSKFVHSDNRPIKKQVVIEVNE